jgi:hypothetical protein
VEFDVEFVLAWRIRRGGRWRSRFHEVGDGEQYLATVSVPETQLDFNASRSLQESVLTISKVIV